MGGKDKIMRAAFELFSERGYASVTIRDIGERAGLTNPALYQHFKSKEALGLAIYEREFQRLLEAIDARTDSGRPPLENLEGYIDAAVALHKSVPSPLLFIEDEQRTFAAAMAERFPGETITPRLSRWIEQGRDEGMFRADVPVRMQVALTIGQITKWAVLNSAGLAPKRGAARALKLQLRRALMTDAALKAHRAANAALHPKQVHNEKETP